MSGTAYAEYLSRFDALVGAVAVGSYGKYDGRLIKKLAEPEFAEHLRELDKLEAHYRDTVARGDTLNNAFVQLLRERRAELLCPPTPEELE